MDPGSPGGPSRIAFTARTTARRQITESVELLREIVLTERSRPRPDSATIASLQARACLALLGLGTSEAGARAEPLLKECLEIREQLFPDGHAQQWLRYNTMSMLGGAILLQATDPAPDLAAHRQRLRDAEGLLLDGYAGLKEDPAVPTSSQAGGDRRREAAERIVLLYTTWDAAEPGQGYAGKAASWRATLDAAAPAR